MISTDLMRGIINDYHFIIIGKEVERVIKQLVVVLEQEEEQTSLE